MLGMPIASIPLGLWEQETTLPNLVSNTNGHLSRDMGKCRVLPSGV